MSKYIRFEKCARKLWAEPWLILPRMHQVISGVFADHLERSLKQASVADLFEPQDAPSMDIRDGVAVIPVKGVISREISQMERISGAADVQEVSDMIDEAEADPNVRAVVFNIDSPGGGVEGVEELANEISAMKKPSIAHTSGMMASAAYWIGSHADAIYATASATVGSIGVYLPILDESRAYEMAGVGVDLIRSTKTPMKGAGFPGTSLTEDQRANFQQGVDYLYERFSSAVKRNRAGLTAEALDGRTMYGSQAGAHGLIDSVASLDKAIQDARKLAGMR
jgi:signal peptide peptidase SppA